MDTRHGEALRLALDDLHATTCKMILTCAANSDVDAVAAAFARVEARLAAEADGMEREAYAARAEVLDSREDARRTAIRLHDALGALVEVAARLGLGREPALHEAQRVLARVSAQRARWRRADLFAETREPPRAAS